jgi:hypothetical protein
VEKPVDKLLKNCGLGNGSNVQIVCDRNGKNPSKEWILPMTESSADKSKKIILFNAF